MTEVLFYHLQRQPLERVLPTLLERSLARGWRVVVQASSDGVCTTTRQPRSRDRSSNDGSARSSGWRCRW